MHHIFVCRDCQIAKPKLEKSLALQYTNKVYAVCKSCHEERHKQRFSDMIIRFKDGYVMLVIVSLLTIPVLVLVITLSLLLATLLY